MFLIKSNKTNSGKTTLAGMLSYIITNREIINISIEEHFDNYLNSSQANLRSFNRSILDIPIFSIGDESKKDISIKYNIPIYYFYDREFKDTHIVEIGSLKVNLRELMVYYAEIIKKAIGAAFWVSKTLNKLIANKLKVFIIDDLRFQEEYDVLKGVYSNLIVLSINNPNTNGSPDLKLDHLVSNFHFENDNDLLDLFKKVYSYAKGEGFFR